MLDILWASSIYSLLFVINFGKYLAKSFSSFCFFSPFSILIAHELHLLKLSYGSLSFLFFLFLFLPVFKFGRFLLSYILAHWSFPQLCPVYWWDDQRILQTCSSVFSFPAFTLNSFLVFPSKPSVLPHGKFFSIRVHNKLIIAILKSLIISISV